MFKPSIILVACALALNMTAVVPDAFARKKVEIVNGKSGKSLHKRGMRFHKKTNVRNRVGRYRPSPFRKYGQYSGDVAISYRPGVGTWSTGTISSIPVTEDLSLIPQVTDVDQLKDQSQCVVEAGVCVIRP